MPATDYKNYYQILGVQKNANEAEIKQAFRKLARQYHPDMNPGNSSAEAKFKEINEAYEVLSDSDKRKKYDQFGQYWRHMDNGQTGTAQGFDYDFGRYSNFDDFINELLGRFGNSGYSGSPGFHTQTGPGGFGGGFQDFGTGFGGPTPGISADAEAELSLSLEDAVRGCEKRLTLAGRETLSVRIPAGAKTGTRIRVKGKGQVHPITQKRGDLYLKVTLQPHPYFSLSGDQLVCEVPITPDEAVLGAEIEVPTPTGMVQMKVPPGVKSGQSLRLRGKGWPNAKGSNGDQLVKLQIVIPKDMNLQELEYYEKIAVVRTSKPRSHLRAL
jgi:curved DNA-binding protein